MGINAKKFVKKNFSWEKSLIKWGSIIEKINDK